MPHHVFPCPRGVGGGHIPFTCRSSSPRKSSPPQSSSAAAAASSQFNHNRQMMVNIMAMIAIAPPLVAQYIRLAALAAVELATAIRVVLTTQRPRPCVSGSSRENHRLQHHGTTGHLPHREKSRTGASMLQRSQECFGVQGPPLSHLRV